MACHLFHLEQSFIHFFSNAVQFYLLVLKLNFCQTDFVRQSHAHLSIDWEPMSLALLDYLVGSIFLIIKAHLIIKKKQVFVFQEFSYFFGRFTVFSVVTLNKLDFHQPSFWWVKVTINIHVFRIYALKLLLISFKDVFITVLNRKEFCVSFSLYAQFFCGAIMLWLYFFLSHKGITIFFYTPFVSFEN